MGVSPPSERKEKKKILPQNEQKSDQTKKLANLVVTKNGEEWFWLEDTINNIFTNNKHTDTFWLFSLIDHLKTRSLHMVQDVSFIPPEECFSNFASEKLLPVAFAFQFPVPGSDSAQLIFTSEMILSRNRDIESKSRKIF